MEDSFNWYKSVHSEYSSFAALIWLCLVSSLGHSTIGVDSALSYDSVKLDYSFSKKESLQPYMGIAENRIQPQLTVILTTPAMH